MKVITFLNEKGGVGKTTLATNTALGLSERGYRVLMLDTDGQGNLTSFFQMTKEPHFYDLALRGKPWAEVVRAVPQDVTGEIEGVLHLVSSNFETTGIAGNTRQQALTTLLFKRFREIEHVYDYVIIDTQPNPTMLHDSLCIITDYLIFPTECESFSALEGLPDSIKHTQENREQALSIGLDKSKILAIVPNRYHQRLGLHKSFLKQLRKSYGNLVWKPIPARVMISEMQLAKISIFSESPNHPVTQMLREFIDRVESETQGVKDV